MFDYNTTKEPLVLREYGRNIQKLTNYIKSIEDKEKRNRYAKILIELMRQLTPSVREMPEYAQKLWDSLYIMSDFNIDIDAPYPMPEKDLLFKKPKRLDYHTNEIRFKYYGRNLELLIKRAIQMDDPKEKEATIICIGKLMKSFYQNWNKENIDDKTIIQHIKMLSNNQLDIDLDKITNNNLFNTFSKEKNKGNKSKRNNNHRRRRN